MEEGGGREPYEKGLQGKKKENLDVVPKPFYWAPKRFMFASTGRWIAT